MPPRDPYLTRVNRALKELGCGVAIEVAPSGKRLRLRSTLPFPDGSWKQRRITTPITYPAGLEQARKLAEELGRDIELHRMGLDPFPFDRWFDEPKTSVGARGGAAAGDAISGAEAIRRTEQWWTVQRRRGVSGPSRGGTACAFGVGGAVIFGLCAPPAFVRVCRACTLSVRHAAT